MHTLDNFNELYSDFKGLSRTKRSPVPCSFLLWETWRALPLLALYFCVTYTMIMLYTRFTYVHHTVNSSIAFNNSVSQASFYKETGSLGKGHLGYVLVFSKGGALQLFMHPLQAWLQKMRNPVPTYDVIVREYGGHSCVEPAPYGAGASCFIKPGSKVV